MKLEKYFTLYLRIWYIYIDFRIFEFYFSEQFLSTRR